METIYEKVDVADDVEVDSCNLFENRGSRVTSTKTKNNPMMTSQHPSFASSFSASFSNNSYISDMNEEETEKFESLLYNLAIPEKNKVTMRRQPKEKKLKLIETYKPLNARW